MWHTFILCPLTPCFVGSLRSCSSSDCFSKVMPPRKKRRPASGDDLSAKKSRHDRYGADSRSELMTLMHGSMMVPHPCGSLNGQMPTGTWFWFCVVNFQGVVISCPSILCVGLLKKHIR